MGAVVSECVLCGWGKSWRRASEWLCQAGARAMWHGGASSKGTWVSRPVGLQGLRAVLRNPGSGEQRATCAKASAQRTPASRRTTRCTARLARRKGSRQAGSTSSRRRTTPNWLPRPRLRERTGGLAGACLGSLRARSSFSLRRLRRTRPASSNAKPTGKEQQNRGDLAHAHLC